MKFQELVCNFMSLYAVPFFVWAAHKNFAVLVFYPPEHKYCCEREMAKGNKVKPLNGLAYDANIHDKQ